jgi:(1->4)-alpha-D-glucan 1-alpha-D-glucosylmutase
LLDEVQTASPAEMLDNWTDGRAKLFTLTHALRFRREHADLFLYGDYDRLSGDADDPHVIAFSRKREGEEVIVVVPRFLAAMMGGVPRPPLGVERWRMSSIRLPRRLSKSHLRNVFTGDVVEPLVHRNVPWLLLGNAFQSWPVALLYSRG